MSENIQKRLSILSDKLAKREINTEDLIEYKQLLELSNAIFRAHAFKRKHSKDRSP